MADTDTPCREIRSRHALSPTSGSCIKPHHACAAPQTPDPRYMGMNMFRLPRGFKDSFRRIQSPVERVSPHRLSITPEAGAIRRTSDLPSSSSNFSTSQLSVTAADQNVAVRVLYDQVSNFMNIKWDLKREKFFPRRGAPIHSASIAKAPFRGVSCSDFTRGRGDWSAALPSRSTLEPAHLDSL